MDESKLSDKGEKVVIEGNKVTIQGKKDPLDVSPQNQSKENLKKSFDESVDEYIKYGVEFDNDAKEYLRRNPAIWAKVEASIVKRRDKILSLREELKLMNEADKAESEMVSRNIENLRKARDSAVSQDLITEIDSRMAALVQNTTSPETLQEMGAKRKELGDILNNKDLIDEATKLQRNGLVQLSGDVQIPEEEIQRMAEDPDFFRRKTEQLSEAGYDDAVGELSDMIGQKMLPAPSEPMQPLEEEIVSKPVKRPETVGEGTPDQNIKTNIGAMLSGVVGASAEGTVKEISNTLRSQRNKG